MVLGAVYGPVRVFIFVEGAARDNLPPSGPLKALPLRRVGGYYLAPAVCGARIYGPALVCLFGALLAGRGANF